MSDAPVPSARAAGPTLQEIPDSDTGVRGSRAMRSAARFVLNPRGKVFHVTGCDRAGKSQPWARVEPLTNSQIHRWIEPLGIRPCQRCRPLEGQIAA